MRLGSLSAWRPGGWRRSPRLALAAQPGGRETEPRPGPRAGSCGACAGRESAGGREPPSLSHPGGTTTDREAERTLKISSITREENGLSETDGTRPEMATAPMRAAAAR